MENILWKLGDIGDEFRAHAAIKDPELWVLVERFDKVMEEANKSFKRMEEMTNEFRTLLYS
jgi:hypothetical protein